MAYPAFEHPEEDTFRWICPITDLNGGRLKTVLHYDDRIEEEVAEIGKGVERRIASVRPLSKPGSVTEGGPKRIREPDGFYEDDPFAWRMAGYDAQHKGYYPHSLAPPLEEKWSFRSLYNDFLMISASSANGHLYVGNGGRRLYALDVYSGDTVWVQWLTSNVWTTALAPGDTLLFAGTSIEPSLTWPTFFCLDARTGEVKWSKYLHTIETPLVVTHNQILATNFFEILVLDFEGNVLWEDTLVPDPPPGMTNAPAYSEERIYTGDVNCALLALDSHSGDTIWIFPTSDWIDCPPMISSRAAHFFSGGYLYRLEAETGNLLWQRLSALPGPIAGPISYTDKLYYNVWTRGVEKQVYALIYCLDASSGETLWEASPLSGGSLGGMVVSSNGIFWSANTDNFYALQAESGNTLFQEEISGQNWQCWFWPLVYKDHILIAGDRVTAYQAQIPVEIPVDSIFSVSVFPNPASDRVDIQLRLPEPSEVDIQIYNQLGALVRELHWEEIPQGPHSLAWDGRDGTGRRVSSSIYFILVRIGGERIMKKVICLTGGENG